MAHSQNQKGRSPYPQQQQARGYPAQQPMQQQGGYPGQPYQQAPYPGQAPYQGQAGPAFPNEPPPPYSQGQGNYQPQYQYRPPAPNQTVVVQGGFDAGARFGPGQSTNIPPPPPGCMPNAAQMATAQGQNVVVTQRPGDFWTGGSDGGYTIW
ncbi:DAZ-associated protein 2-like isoform X2 [Lineus longissimus]|uniref:DAZ-associated protein 2-like isoform X2 n=1 Tax=Lineus longissimus TaxID=88925 RepID=UPI00315CCB93